MILDKVFRCGVGAVGLDGEICKWARKLYGVGDLIPRTEA